MEHGLSKTRLYSIYSGMKQRCYNPNNQHYQWYGGKGITICDDWLGDNGLQNFFDWSLSHGYNENLTIDRLDSNKGYSPDNCQWVTSSINSSKAHINNSKNSITMGEKIKIVLKRRNMTLGELAEQTSQSRQNLSNKMSRDNFNEKELLTIAGVLDCTYHAGFTMNDTGEEI